MRISASALLRVCLLASVPICASAQTEPVVFEAESGTLGANLATGVDGAVTFVTTTVNSTTPPAAPHIGTYAVTFPAAGNYELYARYSVGPDGPNDDSWYFGQGFGEKTPEVGAQWALQNETNTGFTNPNATVLNGGSTGSNVFKWVKITGSQGPAAWVVPAGSLTQTFQFGSREDGMRMDKFAFGRAGVCYTVNDLNNAGPATGTCPPPPPPDPPPYTRTEPAIATGLDKYLGAAWSPGTASLNFANYWNQVTPENGGKWGSVEGTRDVMNWAQADAAYALAKANGFPFKWHTFIWGNQQPAWIESLPPAEQLEEIREWYAAVAERFPDIDQIEVVNEPLHDPPRGATNGNYIEALGGNGVTGWDWIITAFTLAREYFPEAELILNDYSITNDGNATTNYINIINLLKERGLIDAIGDQAHAFSTTEPAPMNNHRNNLNRLAATGLPIYITELDIDGVLAGVVNDPVQVANFQRIFPVFWEHPAVKGVTIWGYVRGFHWRNAQGDWLLYPNGGERPALQWLIRYVQNAPAVVGPQTLTVNEAAAGGSPVGAVLASDADAGTTYSQWQIASDPSGKFVIDAASGVVSLAGGASLDFETATSHTISVTVWDGYVRSAAGNVTIKVTNANDNVPYVLHIQNYAIDATHEWIGRTKGADEDDFNEPGFTTFSNWQIVGGDAGGIFVQDGPSGQIRVAQPLNIDFSRTSYTLLVTVSDGVHTSEPSVQTVTIPSKVQVCKNGTTYRVPKLQAMKWLREGAGLGLCKARR
ncbi:MAG TPA: endo-1,4-beta-xylanase [Steroidobacteraceae bacterium]|nr:endo-1,4-beta-xylanase [Steroidobacteraceae bacterium]